MKQHQALCSLHYDVINKYILYTELSENYFCHLSENYFCHFCKLLVKKTQTLQLYYLIPIYEGNTFLDT